MIRVEGAYPLGIKIEKYQYKHHFLLIIRIYFNLFRKVVLTTIHVQKIEFL